MHYFLPQVFSTCAYFHSSLFDLPIENTEIFTIVDLFERLIVIPKIAGGLKYIEEGNRCITEEVK